MKTCFACESTKPLDQFFPNTRARDGRSGECWDCVRERLRKLREKRRAERAVAAADIGGKRCRGCGLVLPLDSFHPRPQSVDGRASRCRRCLMKRRGEICTDERRVMLSAKACEAYWRDPERVRQRARARTKANPELMRERSRQSKQKAMVERWPELLAVSAHRHYAVNKYGASDVDADYIRALFESQGGMCHWLQIPMIPSPVPRDPRRPSLDRLDCKRGYLNGNVVLACQFANMGRSNCAVEAFVAFIQEMRAHIVG